MIVAHNMSKTVFAYPSSAFVCLRGNCTGFQLDNVVNRIQHTFSFKMMYRNLGTQGVQPTRLLATLFDFIGRTIRYMGALKEKSMGQLPYKSDVLSLYICITVYGNINSRAKYQ